MDEGVGEISSFSFFPYSGIVPPRLENNNKHHETAYF